MKLVTPGLDKNGLPLHGDFFERFKAVGNKTGADDIHAPCLLPAELFQVSARVGSQPFRPAKSGLETNLVLVCIQFQRLCQQSPRFLAFAVVGIAFVQDEARYSMKTHHELIGFAAFAQ